MNCDDESKLAITKDGIVDIEAKAKDFVENHFGRFERWVYERICDNCGKQFKDNCSIYCKHCGTEHQ